MKFFSLPKIIGSISGGLVVTKNKNFIKFCKQEQKKNKKLGSFQAKERFDNFSKKQNFNTWLYYESWNTYTEYNSLINIERCLKNFDINKEIIIKRLNFISQEMKINFKTTERLGPVLPLPLKNFQNISNLCKKIFN